MEDFVRSFWLARGEPATDMQNASFFHHVLSWWPHRCNIITLPVITLTRPAPRPLRHRQCRLTHIAWIRDEFALFLCAILALWSCAHDCEG